MTVLEQLLSIASDTCKGKALAILGEDNVALLIASEIASQFRDLDLSPTRTAEALSVARSTAGNQILSLPTVRGAK